MVKNFSFYLENTGLNITKAKHSLAGLYVMYKGEKLAVFYGEDQFARADEYIRVHGPLAEWTYQKLSTKKYQNWSDAMKI